MGGASWKKLSSKVEGVSPSRRITGGGLYIPVDSKSIFSTRACTFTLHCEGMQLGEILVEHTIRIVKETRGVIEVHRIDGITS